MSTSAPPIATLTIPSDPRYLTVCRQALVGAVAGMPGLTDEDLDDLKLLLSEACSNAIVHGYDNSPAGRIEIEFRTSPGEVEIAVIDHGHGFPDGEVPETVGLGLALLRRLSSHTDIEPLRSGGGACVTFALAFSH
jgi:anti-sigma regulatory factor (Ser/Thr protein kinase)